MVPNATKLCYKSVFLHFSSILSQLLLKIVHYFGFRHAHKPKFGLVFLFFFCWFISNFFSLLLLSFFSPFLFSLSSTLYHLSIHWKSFGLSPSKNLEMEHWSTRWLGLFYHQLCSQNWTRFSGIALPGFGRYSKWTQYGWICPCCASCLSKQSGDVKNDDVTSGWMVPDFDVGKIQLLTEKS